VAKHYSGCNGMLQQNVVRIRVFLAYVLVLQVVS
jgi:hypothetical protein